MAIALHLHTFVATVSSSGGGIRGFPPLPEKLTCPPTSPQLFCLQNVDFAIAMPFIGRLVKCSSPPVDPDYETLIALVFCQCL